VSSSLPQLELECMKTLWKLRTATVAQVRSALARPLAYTTVMTVLDRMSSKGVVARSKNGRAYLYSPLLELETAREQAVSRLVTNLFEDDRQALLQYLSGMRQRSPVPARRKARPETTPKVFVPEMDETLL
jgi:predicted transcriptional regulator